jgi:hypothetical protein
VGQAPWSPAVWQPKGQAGDKIAHPTAANMFFISVGVPQAHVDSLATAQ